MKVTRIFLFMIILCAQVNALDNIPYGKKNILFFPFYNYTNSDEKYVSEYLRELLEDNFNNDDFYILKQKVTLQDAALYDESHARSILYKKKADYGVIGRYFIHKNKLIIDFRIIISSSSRVIEGNRFEAVIDDRFLDVLERFAQSRVDFINTSLSGNGNATKDIFSSRFKTISRFISWFVESPVGVVLQNKWIFAFVICLFFYLLSRMIVFFFDKVLQRIARRTKTDVDNLIIKVAKKPFRLTILLWGVKIAVATLNLKAKTALYIDTALIALMVLVVTYLLASVYSIIITSWGKHIAGKIDPRIYEDLVPLFVKIGKTIIFVIGILTVLSKFEIDITPLIASLGIAGFAIGFAVKDSLANIIGGIVLILDHSFAVGDKVTIDGDIGIIKDVGLRNTKLLTFDNEIIVIPNGELINKKFKNYVLPDPMIRVVVEFGVAYGSDIEYVEKVVLEAISGIDDILDDPAPTVVFVEMGDFSLNMQAKIWVPDYINQYNKFIEMTKVVYNALNKADINIPFPTHTVYVEEESADTKKKKNK